MHDAYYLVGLFALVVLFFAWRLPAHLSPTRPARSAQARLAPGAADD
jgi:hypothetical protein